MPPPAAQLTPIQMQVFLKYLMGHSVPRIAFSLGLTDERQVESVLNSHAVQAALRDARQTVVNSASTIMERLGGLAPDALGTIDGLMRTARSEKVRLNAAQDIMDRAGYKPTNRFELAAAGLRSSEAFNYDALPEADRQVLRDIAKRAARATMLGSGEQVVDLAAQSDGSFSAPTNGAVSPTPTEGDPPDGPESI